MICLRLHNFVLKSLGGFGGGEESSLKIACHRMNLLFHCTESNALWLEFISWWRLKCQQVITLTECVVLYGYHSNIKNKKALNVTLLLAKYHFFCYNFYKLA